MECYDSGLVLHARTIKSKRACDQCWQDFYKPIPDITLEFYVDYRFTNVVEERFDAGIRLGEAISKDIIAVRIGPDWRLAVVGSPAYLERYPEPKTPYDSTKHACANIRHRASGAVYA